MDGWTNGQTNEWTNKHESLGLKRLHWETKNQYSIGHLIHSIQPLSPLKFIKNHPYLSWGHVIKYINHSNWTKPLLFLPSTTFRIQFYVQLVQHQWPMPGEHSFCNILYFMSISIVLLLLRSKYIGKYLSINKSFAFLLKILNNEIKI